MSKASTHDEWRARSARENLDIPGWARARTFGPRELADLNAPSAEDVLDLEEDPEARWISDVLWGSPGWAETAERFFGLRGKRRSEEELRSMGWPASSQEMQEHLERLAPSWRVRSRASDPTPRGEAGSCTWSTGRRRLRAKESGYSYLFTKRDLPRRRLRRSCGERWSTLRG